MGTSDDLKDFLTSPLARASQLAEVEEDVGDFGPDNTYKGFAILPEPPLEAPDSHSGYLNGFYVLSPRGMLGFVPWSGSVVVWETEAAWYQDLRKTDVQSLLKEEKEGKKK